MSFSDSLYIYSVLKRIAAILLLGILLFNLFGYRLFMIFMENTENSKLETRLDENNYDESELISVKVPAIHLSSYTNSRLFERVDGQVEVNGISYKYVKRRLLNDTLEMLCIPNHAIMQLQAVNDNFFKLVNDLQLNHLGKKNNISPSSHNNSPSEYYTLNTISLDNNKYFTFSQGQANHSLLIASCYLDAPAKPPENC